VIKTTEPNILFLNHDLRNNVGAAISHAQLLTIDNPELEGEENITAIVENLKKAILLTEEISFSMSNEKGEESVSENGPLLTTFPLNNEYFESIKASYKEFSRMYPIQFNISFEIRNGSYFIKLNLDALNALRENLINNSVKAGATIIDVHYEMREYSLVVTLKDNGQGMDQEAIDKITLSQHGDGLIHGVGTKIILKTAEENGFFISYTSDNESGTTYRALCPYEKV